METYVIVDMRPRIPGPSLRLPPAPGRRDFFVPAPHLFRFASSLVVANGERDPWPLPAEGGDEELAVELRRHLASVGTP